MRRFRFTQRPVDCLAFCLIVIAIYPNLALAGTPGPSLGVSDRTMSLDGISGDFKKATLEVVRNLFEKLRLTDGELKVTQASLRNAEEKINKVVEELTALRTFWPNPKTQIDEIYNRVLNLNSPNRAEAFLDELTIRITRFEAMVEGMRGILERHELEIAKQEKEITGLKVQVDELQKKQTPNPAVVASTVTSTRTTTYQSEPALWDAPPPGSIEIHRCVDMVIQNKLRHGSVYMRSRNDSQRLFVEHKKTIR